MSRRLVILGSIVALGTLLFSCKKEEERIPVLTLPSPMVTAAGGTQTLSVAAESSWTLTVEYPVADSQKGWVSVSPASGSGFGSAFVTVEANTGDNPRTASIRLDTRSHTLSVELTQAASSVHNMPMWMELPAIEDNPKLSFFIHDWAGGQYINKDKSPKRNYSFYWDSENYVSHWVAYPLNKSLRSGNYGRYDNHDGGGFIADPILESLKMKQPNLFKASYGGSDTIVGAPKDGVEGWARGHQIPSYDRQDNEGANKATYYVTNITPQQYDFNGGIWAKLEGKVRDFADNSDTLYVCTGCDLNNSPGWTSSKSGVSARVPSAYYKALLRKKGNDYSAVAYYLPHSYSIASEKASDLAKYLISISALEQKTGVDFFANLPAVLGKDKAAAIEKADPNTTLKNW